MGVSKAQQQKNLCDAEFAVRMNEKKLARILKKTKDSHKKEEERLVKMMGDGMSEQMINGQSTLVCNLESQANDYQLRKQQLHLFRSQIESAKTNAEIGDSMLQVAHAISRFGQSISLENIEEAMGKLDRAYEDINVMTGVMDASTTKGTAVTASPEDIERIKRRAADAAGIEFKETLGVGVPQIATPSGPTKEEEEASEERLKALREMA